MKTKLFILSVLFAVSVIGGEIDTLKLSSQIKTVTVFFDGAQITREASITISPGKHVYYVENLPAEINPQSIQVDNSQKGEIISVKHELVYPKEKSETVLAYEEKIENQRIRYEEISNEIQVYEIEEKILLNNSTLDKSGEGSSVQEISDASDFYRTKLNEIRKNKLSLYLELEDIKENIQNLYAELNKVASSEAKTHSKISIVYKTDKQINAEFKISYFVASAGWTPLYDFRVNDINEPLNLVYNANIFQSTGEEWKNVDLILSTGTPSISNVMPELGTWFVERGNTYPKKNIEDGPSALQGTVIDDKSGEVIPFASIAVFKDGQLITGTTSDKDGRYTIKPIKSGYYDVKAIYVGYKNAEVKNVALNANKTTFLDLKIQASEVLLCTFEVVDYSVPLIDRDASGPTAALTSHEIEKMPGRNASSVVNVGGVFSSNGEIGSSTGRLPAQYGDQKEVQFISGYEASTNITSLEYKIDIPYTIPTDGNNYGVKIQEVEVPVNYRYSCIPKLDNDVFLIAEISNWTELNLISGQSSIYYNGIFTGESEIIAEQIEDTLAISLNRDKNIIVERTLLKEKNDKQFIGNNIRETINWSITVKNNKAVKTKIFIEDQFPISENKSIDIELLEFSNGKVNYKTGKVVWEIDLEPNEKVELSLIYSVKYPKYMRLNIE